MWYLALLAVGIAVVATWSFFKKATPDSSGADVAITKEAERQAAVTAVVEQVKVIAAERAEAEAAAVPPPPPPAPAPKPKTKRKTPSATAPKKAAGPKRTKKQ